MKMKNLNKMGKVLITGGAGFIGSNLALTLIQRGYEITVMDNLSKQIHGNHPEIESPLYQRINGKVRFINGSVITKSDWLNAIKDQDAIIHLAAETGTGQSMYAIEQYINVNIVGTAIMLDVLANYNHSVKKVVVASSRAVYGEGKYYNKELGFIYPKHRDSVSMDRGDFDVKYENCKEQLTVVATDENSKLHPSSVYGITKLNQEQMVMTVCPSIGVHPVAFRYQNVYGPGQSLKNPYTGILSIFSTQIKNGNSINIFEDGKESRDFVYIADVVSATILGLEKDEANGEIFNVGTGIPTDVITVANSLIKNYGAHISTHISSNYRLGDIRHNYADLTKIKTKLGYEPVFTFQEGIKNFTDWVNQQDVEKDSYMQSIEEMKTRGLYR